MFARLTGALRGLARRRTVDAESIEELFSGDPRSR
jgi:hypothetical protein